MAGRPKGYPKSGGRPKGRKNKKTEARELIAVDPALATLPPLEFLLSVYRTPTIPLAIRIDAAKGAAPYFHSKLQAADPSAKHNDPYAGKTTAELNALFMAELAKRGLMLVDIPEPEEEPPAGIAPPRGSNGSGGSQY